MENLEKKVLTVIELAKLLNIGKNSAYNLVHQDGFPKIKIGKKFLIPIKSLNEWLEKTSWTEVPA